MILKQKVVGEFLQLLNKTLKGLYPKAEFILEEIALIDLLEDKCITPSDFTIQYYLNNKWLTN